MSNRRKKQIKKLDSLWGIAVFARDGGMCQKCGKLGHSPHHVVLRRYASVRHELDNGLTLCHECHIKHAHGNPRAFKVWFKDNYWERYEAVRRLKNNIKPDLDMVEEKLKEIVGV